MSTLNEQARRLTAPRRVARRTPRNGRQHTPAPVFGEALFRDALIREQRCTDRFAHPFVVLLVDAASARDRSPRSPWPDIIQALSVVKRRADILGWFEREAVLGLILADTAAADAGVVEDRVRRELASRLEPESLVALSVRLYAHAGHPCPEGARMAPVALLVEALEHSRSRWGRDAVKRTLDIVGSLVALASLAPLFLLIALLIRLTSPGPALFRQVRVGRRGEPFTMLKFRTMHTGASDEIHQKYVESYIQQSSAAGTHTASRIFKMTDDPRVTGAGHVLRRTSLDELPQFLNVLRGEMSLVGPRPALPFEVERYQPWHRKRVLEVKPGITGLWQVSGRSCTTFEEMVRLDLRYARKCTFWTDIQILAATPRAVVSGDGAW
jgi:lipopolysaccharide/colanic/teichoic acid biosynthesis glycosyltransferase